MSEHAIVVENLSKSYQIGHRTAEHKRYVALRDVIARETRNFTRKTIDFVRGRQIVQGDEIEEFWALQNVSFEVKQGEALGIIGRNGAGKSTLLKILSRITEPTKGRILLHGRVASLLEVGTGFHPELTGRENIFLNGAILGMRQQEIRKKFDEIVAFAEVEKFLDTPVKYYSSGMYVRLAFAVAAHLEPEILIVDEVLAVGDAEFQKKCLGKMSEVARENRTVLFVSHNMAAVRNLTNKSVLLDRGVIAQSGNTEDVVTSYFAKGREAKSTVRQTEDLEFFRHWRLDGAPAKIIGINVASPERSSNSLTTIKLGQRFTIKIRLEVYKRLNAADIALTIKTAQGDSVVSLLRADQKAGVALEPGRPTVEVTIGDLPLAPGDYFVDVLIDPMVGGISCDAVYNYPLLSVVNDGQITLWLGRPWGVIQCQDVRWNISSD
jgi:lipopolysaccharide transport system ATP-binding protein